MKPKYLLLLIYGVILMACHRVEYNSSLNEADQDVLQIKDHFREGVPVFSNNLLSHKLDLVIVLDTQKKMTDFYKKNIFGSQFLTHFKDFDWQVAYTDTSVSEEFLKTLESDPAEKNDPAEKTDPAEKKDCKGLVSRSITSSALGYLLSAPYILFEGLRAMSECASIVRQNRKNRPDETLSESNGRFLSFEYKGKKQKHKYLTKQLKDYQDIFNDTFVSKNKKTFSSSYDAPVLSGDQSHPLLAVLLSISKQVDSENPESFFRPDSRITYVVITPTDGKMQMDSDVFQTSLSHAFKGTNRFQMIPVIVPKQDTFCALSFSKMGVQDVKSGINLKTISKGLGTESLNICTPDLGDHLATEIKKNLHSGTEMSQ